MSLIFISNPICINEIFNSSISLVMIKNTKTSYGLDVFEYVFCCLKVGFLWSNHISIDNPYDKCYCKSNVCQENELPYNSLIKSCICTPTYMLWELCWVANLQTSMSSFFVSNSFPLPLLLAI